MERIVCSDKQLSSLDLTMSQLYLSILPPEGDTSRSDLRKELREFQRLWRASRLSDCNLPTSGELSIEATISGRTCLVGVYQKRLSTLSDKKTEVDAGSPGGGASKPNETEVVHRECLIVFDDSFNVHSVEWNLTTTYKKLRHCYELQLNGPAKFNVKGLADDFVKSCTDKGLNDKKTRFIVQGAIALGTDILSAGATAGGATAATIAQYVDNVVNVTIECVTDVETISKFVEERLRKSFSARVEHKSEWVYFKL